MTEPLPGDLLTTTQAADLLGFRQATIRQLIAAGRLTATRLGRDLFLRRADVEAYRRARAGQAKRGRAPRPSPGPA